MLPSLPRIHLAPTWTQTKDPECAATPYQTARQLAMEQSINRWISTRPPDPTSTPSRSAPC